MYNLRHAETKDLEEIVALGKGFWSVTPYATANVKYDPKSTREFLHEILDNHILVVAEHNKSIVSFLAFVVVPLPFNNTVSVAQEMFWWAHPDHRGVGSQLLGFAEKELEGIVDIICMGELRSSIDLEEFYTRSGYVCTERTYAKVI